MFGYRSHTLGLLKSKGRSAQEVPKKMPRRRLNSSKMIRRWLGDDNKYNI